MTLELKARMLPPGNQRDKRGKKSLVNISDSKLRRKLDSEDKAKVRNAPFENII